MRDHSVVGRHPAAVPSELIEVNLGARPLDEILDVAGRAREERRRLQVTGLAEGSLEDLVRIAVVGGESVVFVDASRPPPRADRTTPRRWFQFRFRGAA